MFIFNTTDLKSYGYLPSKIKQMWHNIHTESKNDNMPPRSDN